MHDRGMVPIAKAPPNLGQRPRGELLRQIHGNLPRPRDIARTAGRGHVGQADIIMFGDLALNFLNGHAPVMGAEDIVQDLLRAFERNGPAKQIGPGDQAIERAFQFPHIGRDLMRQEFHDARRHRNAG